MKGEEHMGQDGREVDKFPPALMGEFAKDGAAEKPLSAADATGGAPDEHLQREIAAKAWQYLAEFAEPDEQLPTWIMEYLIGVGRRVSSSLGPSGGLNRDDAHFAIGIDKKAWPENSSPSVYAIMQGWIEDPRQKDITGPTSAAQKYIREYMSDDKLARSSTIIRLYTEGKRRSRLPEQ